MISLLILYSISIYSFMNMIQKVKRGSVVYTDRWKGYDDWKMNKNYKRKYEDDKNVKHIRISFESKHW